MLNRLCSATAASMLVLAMALTTPSGSGSQDGAAPPVTVPTKKGAVLDAAVNYPIMESYSTALQASLESRARIIASSRLKVGDQRLESVFHLSKRWPQRSTLRVAFLDGDATLHKAVADAASVWLDHVNLKFDFIDPATGKYRRWTDEDQSYQADIRISFDRKGYWSLVGTDSKDPTLGEAGDTDGGRPNQRSMNFGGYKNVLPHDYKGTVAHEFGHALGFEHEHSHPSEGCNLDFRWHDDPGYVATTDKFGQFVIDESGHRPGIYTVLGGPPNNWPAWKVDGNLRQLAPSNAYQLGPFDRTSIMKYYFPEWMFQQGASSPCFSVGENLVLSLGDQTGARNAYPSVVANDGNESANPIASKESQRLAVLAQMKNVKGMTQQTVSHYENLRAGQNR
jgi:hypothetical protein